MKSVVCSIVFVIVVFLSHTADASVVVGDHLKFGNGPGSPGGLFRVDNLSNGIGYDFDTFCVELEEKINFSSTYVVEGISLVTKQTGKPLGGLTAWLYDRFLDGQLSNFNAALAADNNALQFGLWKGMGYSDTKIKSLAGEGFFTTNSVTFAAKGWAANYQTDVDNGHWSGTGNIFVINLRKLRADGSLGAFAQDQLVRTPPVPEPGALVAWTLLLATGLILARIQRRRNLAT